jgi:hypothetical protein
MVTGKKQTNGPDINVLSEHKTFVFVLSSLNLTGKKWLQKKRQKINEKTILVSVFIRVFFTFTTQRMFKNSHFFSSLKHPCEKCRKEREISKLLLIKLQEQN